MTAEARPIPDVDEQVHTLVTAGTNCAASNAYTASNILDLQNGGVRFRRVALYLAIDFKQASDQVDFLPLIAPPGIAPAPPAVGSADIAISTAPALSTDNWYSPVVQDGSVTAAALTSGKLTASGVVFTVAPSWGQGIYRPMRITTDTAVNATDKARLCAVVDVTHAGFLCVLYAELSGGTVSQVGIKAVRAS